MKISEQDRQRLRNQSDDYEMTIYAMLGFLNLFRFDDARKEMRPEIEVFQGRYMKTTAANRVSPSVEVTPDLCIQISSKKGIIAEVKYSFPNDRSYWKEYFDQLMSYDDDLSNWHTSDGKIGEHEIVMLPEQGRSVDVSDRLWELLDKGEVKFNRNFCVVEFSRSLQGKQYLFFRRQRGHLTTNKEINDRLHGGIKVPIEKLMLHYERCQICDSPPPVPRLLHLIWQAIILERASEDDRRFRKLKRNNRMVVEVSVDDIVEELSLSYSFHELAADIEHQPRVPRRAWVIRALNLLVKTGEAEWIDQSKVIRIYFRKYDDANSHFEELWLMYGEDSDEHPGQQQLI